MLEEFTDLEITVGRILAGGELGAAYRPEPRQGLAAWFGDWMPRTRPGESQAAGVIERNGEPGRRGLWHSGTSGWRCATGSLSRRRPSSCWFSRG